jgi:dihydropteroate synthase
MGILNATPDSFYAGSRFPNSKEALDRARILVEEGADLIDLGGESTRPGSDFISLQEELDRTLPILEALGRDFPIPISIDTGKAEVARRARVLGASILNDVSALRRDPAMIAEAVHFEAVILMHCGGESPKVMQNHPVYADVVAEVKSFLAERKAALISAGGKPERIFLDPGIGFGKTLDHNLALLNRLDEFSELGPVVLGASRKAFIGKIRPAFLAREARARRSASEKDVAVRPDSGPADRLDGSLAAACWAASRGVNIVRVHDVLATRKALEVWRAIEGSPSIN